MIAYLPKLSPGLVQELQLPSKAGVWEPRKIDTSILQLANSIEVPATDAPIHSVPDVWARMMLFSNALYDKKHSLHNRYLGEWRGMLAILALRQIEKLNWLKVLKVDLPVPKIDKERKDPLNFLEVAGRLKPKGQTISADADWDSIFIFFRKKDGEGEQYPLALSSPKTLICTGANSGRALRDMGIAWFDGKKLEDPVAHLTQDRRRQVSEWVMVVRQFVSDQANESSNLTGRLIALLKDFAVDLDERTAAQEKFSDDELRAILSDVPAEMPLTGKTWVVLGRAHSGEASGSSDLELLTPLKSADASTAKGTPPDRYIVVDEDFANQLDRDPHDIRVLNDVTLGNVRALVTGYGSFPSGNLLNDNIKWVGKSFFFNDTIIAAKGANAFPAAAEVTSPGQKVGYSAIPPISESARALLGLDKLLENISIDWQSKEKVVVSLDLQPLLMTGAKLRISKTYEGDSLATLDLGDHLIGIWPNFTTPDNTWKTYYLHHSWPSGLRDTPVSLRMIDTGIEKDRIHAEQNNQTGSHFRITRMSSFPRALEFTLKSKSVTGGVAAGILALRPAPVVGNGPKVDMLLGVDFGSTGSNVFYKIVGTDIPPKELIFRDRILRINAPDPSAAARFLREFVQDADRPAFNLLSVFQDFLKDQHHERQLLVDGHVLDIADPDELSGDQYGKVCTNLKWKGVEGKYIARDFLHQILLQSAVEAAAMNARSVEVRFSYPTAYSAGDLQTFLSIWEEIRKTVSDATGVPITLRKDLKYCKESVAAARFFANPQNGDVIDLTQGGLAIDIGGGTSDYAFFYDRALRGHTSILFAGRDIFLGPLRKHHQVLHKIADFRKQYESIRSLDTFVNTDAEKFNAYLDAVISRYGNEYKHHLRMTGDEETNEVSEFIDIVATGLCGVLFYGGLTVRMLAGDGGDVKLPANFRIHLGGNGCRMFDWILLGSDELLEHHANYQRAVNAFRVGLGNPSQDVQLVKSGKPKAEVAFGILDDAQQITIDHDEIEFAGEFHLVDKKEMSWETPLSGTAAEEGRLQIDRRLDVFLEFLNSIGTTIDTKSFTNLGIGVDNRLNALKEQIQKAKPKAQGGAPTDVVVGGGRFKPATGQAPVAGLTAAPRESTKLLRSEPLFVMTLKQYLEDRVRVWAAKYGH